MKLTDTHCHLADPALLGSLPQVFAAARAAGVCRFIVPATQRSDFADVAALSALPSVHIALGIHPWFAGAAIERDFAELEQQLLKHPKALVGEIGLDYGRAQTQAQRQRQIVVFEHQLVLAQRLHRPVIIHNLKAAAAIMQSVKNCRFTQGGIVHAFSGSLEEARAFMDCGFKIGIGSLLLNPAARKARSAAAELPAENIVLETDSPFMLKNAVNTPANVQKIAAAAAQLRGIKPEDLAAQTERNVNALLADINRL
ncbi:MULTISPECIES: TatD family hydrolase [unclassified Neisseria]|uniref:TatD family hydrolase n=1 Tax=unclassified Neisseria TaxID=2623750 RepID=UPI001072DC33|nr:MULTISPECIES: TatD family hydrolase [unclassified Neisseria]MBF0804139.1 TatD family hydrolase [Neisseria sp. 19428wB4_WF04]TFU43095.1 TatD family deoxyribonuclease [Neisseria sp. WF04]